MFDLPYLDLRGPNSKETEGRGRKEGEGKEREGKEGEGRDQGVLDNSAYYTELLGRDEGGEVGPPSLFRPKLRPSSSGMLNHARSFIKSR